MISRGKTVGGSSATLKVSRKLRKANFGVGEGIMGSYSSENAKIFNARGSSYPFSSPYVNRSVFLPVGSLPQSDCDCPFLASAANHG